jgi:4-hydroxy-tetrahydrodipicolinate reductase
MIRVGVCGALGRMGSLIIRNVAEDKELELVKAFDIRDIGVDAGEKAGIGRIAVPVENGNDIENLLSKADVDVLVDFTIAESAVKNITVASNKGINLVVGTTGFTEDQWTTIQKTVEKKVAAVISPNFSVGVNLFWKIVRDVTYHLADYDIEIIEAHHRFKKDAPSGTAMKTASIIREILEKMGKSSEFVFGRDGMKERGNEIGIHAIRGGDIVGDHTVLYAGNGERIEITHRAHSRQAFASGVIRAIKFVIDKGPGIYDMANVMGL